MATCSSNPPLPDPRSSGSPQPHRPAPLRRDALTEVGMGAVRTEWDNPTFRALVQAHGQPSGEIGNYVLFKRIGGGGMGEVKLAFDLMTERPVAIKTMYASAQDPKALDRFAAEGIMLAKVNHPNVVSVFEAGYCDVTRQPFLVMQFVPGASLDKVLSNRVPGVDRGPLWGHVGAMSRLASGLHQAHEVGVYHRDLKPGNIIVKQVDAKPPQLVAVDFGLAKDVSSNNKLTLPGMVVGTPQYMAPEQCRGAAVDARTDVYAMGLITYELLERRPPFDATGAMEIMTAHVRQPPRAMSDAVPDLLQAVVLKALNKNPDHRQESARHFSNELRAVYAYLADEWNRKHR